MPEPLELVLRSVAVSLALVLALHALRLPRRPRLALSPLLICLAAYLALPVVLCTGSPLGAPLLVAALLFPFAFWWLAHTAFEDRNDVPWPAWAGAALLLAAGGALASGDTVLPLALHDGARVLQKGVGAAFVLTALVRVWASRAGDLVPGRRTLRGWLLLYIGVHGLAVLGVELALRGARGPAWLELINVSAIALALAVLLALVVQWRPAAVDLLFGAVVPAAPVAATPPAAADDRWLERLQTLMSQDHAYREPELSLSSLAQRLGLPEYRLRELINRRLGFRNFPAFVNHYRLEEVRARLADPALERRPVLTLALEAGFGSIGPFNRAFRDRYGVTPTAFRSGCRAADHVLSAG